MILYDIFAVTCVILGTVPGSLAFWIECGCNLSGKHANVCDNNTCVTELECLRTVVYTNGILTSDIQLCSDSIPLGCGVAEKHIIGNNTLIVAHICCRTTNCNKNNSILEDLIKSGLSDDPFGVPMNTVTPVTPVTATLTATVKPTKDSSSSHTTAIIITTVIIVLFVIVLTPAIIVAVGLWYRKRCYHTRQVASFDDPCVNLTSDSSNGADIKKSEEHNTVSQKVQLTESIGKGHYSEVFLGKRGSQCVAVKVFSTAIEQSWKRELMIYSTFVLENENILQFVDSIQCTGTQAQLWMVFEYHPQQSLCDYLSSNTITIDQLSKITVSISAGLAYLHQDFNAGDIYKPAIAHRDLKSSNILVKSNITCCIADFGLAVISLDTSKDIMEITSDTIQGAMRYMAPEVFDGTIDVTQFESFKLADMYSLGLVLWETTRRCEVSGGPEEYQLPYAERVAHDPSLKEMKKLIAIKQYRPPIPNTWQSDQELSTMAKVIQECWHREPSARLTALRVKKSLQKIFGVTHF